MMYDNEDVEDLVDAVDGKPVNRFTRAMRGTVTSILMETAIPWLEQCFLKYSEQDFHQKVMYEHFDFIADWKLNHSDWYYDFINKARNRIVKRFIDFNITRITERVIKLLKRRGWTIYPGERRILYQTVLDLRKEIYGY